MRIDEDVFEVLYSGKPSRPNIGVNLLVGFEVLKAGHGWSDEEAYDAVSYNVQVRYALHVMPALQADAADKMDALLGQR